MTVTQGGYRTVCVCCSTGVCYSGASIKVGFTVSFQQSQMAEDRAVVGCCLHIRDGSGALI